MTGLQLNELSLTDQDKWEVVECMVLAREEAAKAFRKALEEGDRKSKAGRAGGNYNQAPS